MSAIDLVYGPMLIGVFFNCLLYGILVMQTFIYFQTYKNDNRWIKRLIKFLFIAETINTGCDIAIMYEPLITKWGTLHAMEFFPLMLPSAPIITVCISTPVQIFTAWRIMVISQSKAMAAVITILSLASFGGAIWTAVEVAVFRSFALKPALNPAGAVWFSTSAAADLLISGSLVFSLHSRRTGHNSTDASINRIIRLTIQTGGITTVFAIADLVAFLVSPMTAISFVWDFSLSKLYTNALLSTLNARVGWGNLVPNNQDAENVLFGKSQEHSSIQFANSNHLISAPGGRHEIQSIRSPRTGQAFELQPTRGLRPNVGTNLAKPIHVSVSHEVETRGDLSAHNYSSDDDYLKRMQRDRI